MPSLTLPPWEMDKPTINRHFLGRPRFRMKPKRLVCSGLAREGGGGEGGGEGTETTLPSETSLARDCSATSRFRRADFMFVDVAWR